MVYAPAIDVLYLAERGKARKEEKGVRQAIGVSNAHPPLVVVSRSHIDDELKDYLQLGEHQTVSVGSSLKFCRWRARRSLSALRADQHLGYRRRACGGGGCRGANSRLAGQAVALPA